MLEKKLTVLASLNCLRKSCRVHQRSLEDFSIGHDLCWAK
jgi:hypothetical protein